MSDLEQQRQPSPAHRPTAEMSDTEDITDTDPAPPPPRQKKKRSKKQKGGPLGGGLPTDALGDIPGQALDTVTDTVGGAVDSVGDTVGGVGDAVGGVVGGIAGGEKKDEGKDTLRLRLDLNLEIEVTLKARIHGDLTLALL
jgi:hypothetical protein